MADKKRTTSLPDNECQDSAEKQMPTADGVDRTRRFDLNPNETTSIVNGNHVIVLSKGIESVSVKRSDKA